MRTLRILPKDVSSFFQRHIFLIFVTLVILVIFFGIISALYYRLMVESPNFSMLRGGPENCLVSFNATDMLLTCGKYVYPVNVSEIIAYKAQSTFFKNLAAYLLVLSIFPLLYIPFGGFSLKERIISYCKTYINLTPPNSTFQPALSGLRGLSSLGIGLLHTAGYWMPGLAIVFSSFYYGVPIFLMLSIFLLLGSLERKPGLKRYFKRRITRIWPIYFGTLTAIYLLNFSGGMKFTSFIEYLTFTQYFLHPAQSFPGTGLFWSLQLEEFARALSIVGKNAYMGKNAYK